MGVMGPRAARGGPRRCMQQQEGARGHQGSWAAGQLGATRQGSRSHCNHSSGVASTPLSRFTAFPTAFPPTTGSSVVLSPCRFLCQQMSPEL